MEMEEEQIMQDGNDKQVDLDDEFQSLTDGEEKEKMQDEVDDIGGGGLGYCQWSSDGGGRSPKQEVRVGASLPSQANERQAETSQNRWSKTGIWHENKRLWHTALICFRPVSLNRLGRPGLIEKTVWYYGYYQYTGARL
ncbi:hypothetical protein DY000_02014777 [Brassica cretica]|uniref:Uncharacterized protein n=1 Tax=Brassica cretica TaxID=69181 RepID=A0ABQ7CZN7_BRACR|nr:hypothetical protein DY000_02014777 [Brassica cretica]